MKKHIFALIFIFAFTFIAVFALTSCSGKEDTPTTTAIITTVEDKSTEAAVNHSPSPASSEVTESPVKNTEGVTGECALLPNKYRALYYSVSAPFADLIGGDAELNAWIKARCTEHPNDTNVMVMKMFIQDFNISREDFDRANEEFARILNDSPDEPPLMNPLDYADQEFDEVYNADIIYTFDDEIINAYYLGPDYPFMNRFQYIEALEAGTYQTRTTDFVAVTPAPETTAE